MKPVKRCLEKSGVLVANCYKIGSRIAGVDASARNRTLSRLIQHCTIPPDFEESLLRKFAVNRYSGSLDVFLRPQSGLTE